MENVAVSNLFAVSTLLTRISTLPAFSRAMQVPQLPLSGPQRISAALPFWSELGAVELQAVAQKLSWGGAGAGALVENDFAVDDGPLVAFGALDAAPFVARQVVADFDW